MRERVFLDSGIFIALLEKRDQWHAAAVTLFGGPTPRWSTSYLVVSETYSWFLHRHGEEAARTFRFMLDSLAGLRLFPATTEHHRDVVRQLDSLRGTKLTYVDASSLCWLERHRIRTVWSTDRHLGIAGARVVPRG